MVGPAAEEPFALGDFFRSVERVGRCVVMTDLDDTLTAFFGSDLDDTTVVALASYLDAGGILVFNTGAPFDWFYARLLRPLISFPPDKISVFHQGGYRLVWQGQGRNKGDGVDELIWLSHASDLVPQLDPGQMMYLGDAFGPGGIDRPVAGKVGVVVNVGAHMPGMPGTFVNLGGGFTRTVGVLSAAAGALRASGRAPPPAVPEQAGDAAVWTFEQQSVPARGRVRVRVAASGYVHAGVTHADGRWAPVYAVPLIPAPGGAFEAVLPPDIDAFTFFWTHAPRTPGHPGHWEREDQGGRVFRRASPRRPAGER